MTLTALNKSGDLAAQLLAVMQQLPQTQAVELLHYAEYLRDKAAKAKAKTVSKRRPTKREDNPFLKLSGVVSFEPYPNVRALDEELYGQ